MLRSSQPREPAQPALFRLVNSYYDGEHFSTMYTLYYGGFISRIFDSGPVQPRSTTLVPFYYWAGFDSGMFVHTNCMTLNTQYDTVLVWGKPTTALATELDACFERGQQLDRIAIWRSKPAQ